MQEVIIIGGGLTGLTTAFYLKKAGLTPVVIEKSNRLGGAIQSFSERGFVYEAGPNTGVLSNPEAVELFEDLFPNVELAKPRKESKKRLIWKNGVWEPLPSGLFSALNTPLFSFYDKLNILGEPFRKKGNNPNESLADLVRRRMGKSYLDYAVDPFISGIYAGNPENIVTKYALPKLYNLEQEYGSFIKGSFRKGKSKKSEREKKATREVFSANGGLSKVIEALTEEIGVKNIITGAQGVEVKPFEKGYKVSFLKNGVHKVLETKKVVTTTAAYTLSALLPFISEVQKTVFQKVQYAPIVQVAMGFRRWVGQQLNAFGGLVPGKEKKTVLGILFPSAIFENRSPERGAVLSVFLGGMRNKDLISKSNKELLEYIRSDVKKMTDLPALQPDLLEFFRYEKAIPQYDAHMGTVIETVAMIQYNNPGLIIGGNVKDGIGMADRIKQARSIAEDLIEGKV